MSTLQVIMAIKHFKASIDVALESNHFDVISGKYLVLKSKVKEDGITVVTEKCPFCGRKHSHGTGGKDYMNFISTKDGVKILGHRVAHCTIKNIEFILPNGTIVNNNDGYYLGI